MIYFCTYCHTVMPPSQISSRNYTVIEVKMQSNLAFLNCLFRLVSRVEWQVVTVEEESSNLRKLHSTIPGAAVLYLQGCPIFFFFSCVFFLSARWWYFLHLFLFFEFLHLQGDDIFFLSLSFFEVFRLCLDSPV